MAFGRHFGVHPELEVPCTLPLDVSGRPQDLNKILAPFTPISPQIASSADEFVNDISGMESQTRTSNAMLSSLYPCRKETSRHDR